MTAEGGHGEQTGSRRRRSFARLVLRLGVLLMVVIGGVALGGLTYVVGVQGLRQIVTPIQDNAEQIGELRTRLEGLEAAQRRLNGRQDDRLAGNERQLLQLESSLSELSTQVELLGEELEEQQRLAGQLEGISVRLAEMNAQLHSQEDRLDEIEAEQQAFVDSARSAFASVQLLRAMELTTRAQFWILQGELELAARSVEAARDGLIMAGGEDEAAFRAILVRLELALEELEERPQLAANDLEIAWQLMVEASEPQLSERRR